jgi:DNA-3-methyladenine glycosylase
MVIRSLHRRLKILPRGFYARPTSVVARELLGKVLVRRIGKRTMAGRIAEAEAYASGDPASHAFRGRTARNRALFEEVGRAYIYQVHGHFCLNVVAKRGKLAGGILIRALEPLEGIEAMRRRRPGVRDRDLARGPGNLSRAMAVDMRLYAADMTREGPLFVADDGAPSPRVRRTARIGVTTARDKRWRFVVAGSPFVTRPRLAALGGGPAP